MVINSDIWHYQFFLMLRAVTVGHGNDDDIDLDPVVVGMEAPP